MSLSNYFGELRKYEAMLRPSHGSKPPLKRKDRTTVSTAIILLDETEADCVQNVSPHAGQELLPCGSEYSGADLKSACSPTAARYIGWVAGQREGVAVLFRR